MNNSRIRRVKNAKYLGFCFYMNLNALGDFQICISVPLSSYISKDSLSAVLNIKANIVSRSHFMQTFIYFAYLPNIQNQIFCNFYK